MFNLEREGYSHVPSVANCGHPAKQYNVGLVDWPRRTLRSLKRRSIGLSIFCTMKGWLQRDIKQYARPTRWRTSYNRQVGL
jgi:hypothetical protein